MDFPDDALAPCGGPDRVALVALGVQELKVAQIAMMSNSVELVLLLLTMASHLSSFTIG